jgi:hypothetical protein
MLSRGRETLLIWFNLRRRSGEVVPLVSLLFVVLCFLREVVVLLGEILHLGVRLEGVLLEVLLLRALLLGLVLASLVLHGSSRACSVCSLVVGLYGHGSLPSWLWPLVVIRLGKFLLYFIWDGGKSQLGCLVS